MPRMGLTRERVVDEAATVADEVGLEQLTLATVAKRLNVTLPGMYRHVASLDGLRRDLAVLGVRELTAAMSAAAVGRSGPDALHAAADAYRAYARTHPGRCAASVRAPDPADAEHLAAGAAAVAMLGSVLAEYRLTGDDLVHAIRSLRALLHGFVSLEAAGGFGLPQSVDITFRRLIGGFATTLRR
jgi:AcrR family transcriptional regulator